MIHAWCHTVRRHPRTWGIFMLNQKESRKNACSIQSRRKKPEILAGWDSRAEYKINSPESVECAALRRLLLDVITLISISAEVLKCLLGSLLHRSMHFMFQPLPVYRQARQEKHEARCFSIFLNNFNEVGSPHTFRLPCQESEKWDHDWDSNDDSRFPFLFRG